MPDNLIDSIYTRYYQLKVKYYQAFKAKHLVETKGVLLIHIPKTAGTSVSHAIYGKDLGHFRLMDYLKFHKQPPIVIAVVRDPWSRILSAYEYCVRLYKERGSRQVAFANDYRNYNEFVEKGLKQIAASHYFFWPQYDYLNVNGELKVDYVMNYDSLSSEYREIAIKNGLDSNLAKLNYSRRNRPITDYYDKASIERIAEIYAVDLHVFGFEYKE